jgi:hypothetical protein
VYGACAIDGDVRVIAEKVAPVPMDAVARDERLWLRYGARVHEPLVVGLDPGSLQVVAVAGAADWPPRANEGLTPVAWQGATGGPGDAVQGRSIVRVDAERSLVAWSEGSVEGGYQVRVATLGWRGEPLGRVITLNREGSAMSSPVASIGPSGRGLLAFVESNGHGFQVVAAPLYCAIEHGAVAQALP